MHPMKVTIDISDALLSRARQLAAKEGLTLSKLVERGVSRVVAEIDKPGAFKLRHAAFRGKGLAVGVSRRFARNHWQRRLRA